MYLADGPFTLIRSQNVYNGGFFYEGLAHIGEQHAHQLRSVEVQADDVLLNITGDSVARACQVQPDVLPARVNQHVAILRPDPDRLDARYLRYWLISPETQAALLSWARSGGTRNALTKAMIESLVIPAPPLAQQRRIAHILGTLDDKIELNRRMNATLEEMARALFKSWFVDFEPVRAKMDGRWRRGESLPGMPAELYDLFPERLVPSELGDVPEGWEVKVLSELVELAYGKSLKADSRRAGNIPVYGSNGQIGRHDEKLVDGPGVIVGRKGNPGLVAWSHTDFYPIDTTFYVKSIDKNIGLYFLLYALTEQNLPSVAADSAVPGLNRNLAYMNSQLVPNAGIVAAFDLQVKAFFANTQRMEEEARTLADLRDALLPELVSGEIRDGEISEMIEGVM